MSDSTAVIIGVVCGVVGSVPAIALILLYCKDCVRRDDCREDWMRGGKQQ